MSVQASPPAPAALASLRRFTLKDAGFAAALLAWLAFLHDSEPDWYYFLPTITSFALVVAFAFYVSRRLYWSFGLAALVFLGIYAISWAKYAYVAMKFHVYDIVFHFFSWTQFTFFVGTFPKATILITVLVVASLALAALAWRAEKPVHASRKLRAVMLAASLIGTMISAHVLFDRYADFFTSRRYVFSSFLFSFRDLPLLVRIGGLMEASADEPGEAPAEATLGCAPGGPRPDIVLFLNESVMPPGVYSDIVFPDETKPMFASFDGRVRRLRVETFGGATWLSDFSVLTGLSTWSFGSARTFVAQFVTGRLKHSLPQYLKACGYETTMIYPSMADFAASDRFYRSIGFDRLIDRSVHKAPSERERDGFYHGLVLETLAGAARAGRPQFIVASGMATHSPWDFRFAPDALRGGEKLDWNGDAQTDEFMWRLVLAERDRKAFRAEVAARWPARPVVFLSYGDHQPALKRIPLKNAIAIADDGRADSLTPASTGFETYFSIDAQNVALRMPASEPPILEIPYLSTVLLKAAGLPLDPVFERREKLMEACNGLYHTCPYRQSILRFHRWFSDSGWLRLD